MEIEQAGHVYLLDHVDGTGKTRVPFVNKEPGHEGGGVTTQEIMRMLIDRTRYCNNCMPYRVNEEIVYHMRKIIALHEARALERGVDKGEIEPEIIITRPNGHFDFSVRDLDLINETTHLIPTDRPSTREDIPSYLRKAE